VAGLHFNDGLGTTQTTVAFHSFFSCPFLFYKTVFVSRFSLVDLLGEVVSDPSNFPQSDVLGSMDGFGFGERVSVVFVDSCDNPTIASAHNSCSSFG